MTDQAFADAGAAIVADGPAWDSEIALKVQRPTEAEMGRLKPGRVLIGMLDPYHQEYDRGNRQSCRIDSVYLQLIRPYGGLATYPTGPKGLPKSSSVRFAKPRASISTIPPDITAPTAPRPA